MYSIFSQFVAEGSWIQGGGRGVAQAPQDERLPSPQNPGTFNGKPNFSLLLIEDSWSKYQQTSLLINMLFLLLVNFLF